MPVPTPWPRMIALADMNAFFASIEQHDYPELRGRPVAVTNGHVGTCVITCSYEARQFGVSTGMHIKAAKQRCPGLVQRAARPERYAQVSSSIMRALQSITPDIEIFSVDEAFLDLTHCQTLWGTAEVIANRIQRTVIETAGISCSVGISGDKTVAKFAAKQRKPHGITIIPPWEAEQRLRDVPVTALCGIGDGIGRFLAAHGVYRCGDMATLPISVLSRRFGNPGRRIWHMCQGKDYEKLQQTVPSPKTIGHGKVIPPQTRDRATLLVYFLHMAEKVAARLRRHQLSAKTYLIALRLRDDWIAAKYQTATPIHDGNLIFNLCKRLLVQHWSGQGAYQVQINALDPAPTHGQYELFADNQDRNRQDYHRVVDAINRRYGELAVCPARLLNRSTMPNVISPSWKPFGHRQTIQDAQCEPDV